MRRLAAVAAAAAALAALVAFLLPPPTAVLSAGAPAIDEPVRGAIHVHTRQSDGTGTVEQVAEAAAQAGLRFVVLTDHGDGTREPAPPAYIHGVLCIDAVEVTTFAGHLVALGLWSKAPYPLGGEPRDVVEDVARLGGMSIAAHPSSQKPSLRWDDWSAGVDGLEWLNADSEWRDESLPSLARAFLTYPWRAPETLGALLDRPAAALRTWDELTASRRVVGLAAADAHANLGLATASTNVADRARLALPRYRDIFRTFSIALPGLHLTGDPAADAQAVVGEIRAGRLYSSVDAFVARGRLTFTATSGARTAGPGDDLPAGAPVSIRATAAAPPGSRMVLLSQGRELTSADGTALAYDAPPGPAAYRLEVHLPGSPRDGSGVPWLLSNPIYVGDRPAAAPDTPSAPPRAMSVQYQDGPFARERWGIEKNPESLAELDVVDAQKGTRLLFRYALAGSTARSAWIALGITSGPDLPAFDRLVLSARADRPTRVWVQLWRPVPTGNEYWRRSVYLDSTERDVTVRFDDMQAVGDAPAAPPLADVKTFQILVDQTHTPLGASGRIWLDNIRYAR